MNVMTRAQFINYLEENHFLSVSDPTHPVWFAESDTALAVANPVKCVSFLRVSSFTIFEKDSYWDWCEKTLSGQVRCFVSGQEHEWWGFTDPDDVVIWSLKWIA